MKHLLMSAAVLATAGAASGQTIIKGVDVRNGRYFESTANANFVANFINIGPTAGTPLFAIDYDATATTVWAVNNTTFERGTIDFGTGVFTPIAPVAGLTGGATGLTSASNGSTWYLTEYVAPNTNLYVGDITTGVFTLVGPISVAGIMIDISISSTGRLVGHSISTDSFYDIDPATAAATLIGPHGLAANFAQGMDFDWSTDTLYATIYTGGGTGGLYTVDLTTGAVSLLVDTLPLNAEMEITIENGLTSVGTNYCNPAVPNSTGNPGVMNGIGSASIAANNLSIRASQLPPNANGYFITSMTQGNVMPAGSQGFLCLGGAIGRFVGPGQIMNAGAAGEFTLAVNANLMPTPGGLAPANAGETWNFQAWYRDMNPNVTSNFTDGLSVTFQQ